MFGPSLKSVPGCLVSMVPMLIGVPVAAAPAFGPHDDVLAEPPPELLLVVAELDPLDADVELLAPPALLLLLLLPQPASTTAPTSAASAMIVRRRSAWWNVLLTFVLLLVMTRLTRPGLARRGS